MGYSRGNPPFLAPFKSSDYAVMASRCLGVNPPHMWALVIVKPHLLRGCVLYLIPIVPRELREPFVASRPVEPFDIRILLRLSRLDIGQFDLLGVGPLGECIAQIFRPIVTPDAGRFAAPIHDLVKGTDNALGGKREVHLDA